MCGLSSPSPADKKREADYRAEDDLRTLERAEEIRADGERMGACRRVHRKKQSAARKLTRTLGSRGGR